MKRPNEKYRNHLLAHLPGFLDDNPALRAELRAMHEVVESVLLLDLERVRPDLEASLPERTGGEKPRDRVVLLRSLLLAVRLEEGRINRWVDALKTKPLLRILIGIDPDEAPPSVGAHYRFCKALLKMADPAGRRKAEYSSGNGGRFARNIGAEQKQHEKMRSSKGACEQMRQRLLGDADLPPTFDDLLIDWIVQVGLTCMIDAEMLPSDKLELSVDGTVHKTHANEHGQPVEEPRPEDAAEQTKGRDRSDDESGGVRIYSDPDATNRYSNATESIEFGHLGLGGSIRIDDDTDLPLVSAVADPHCGEAPEMMRVVDAFRRSLEEHHPNLRIRAYIADSLHDAKAVYRWCAAHDIAPIIPLQTDEAPVDAACPRADDGCTPLCPGSIPMKRHAAPDGKVVYRCPALRGLRNSEVGRHEWNFDPEWCPRGQERCTMVDDSSYLTLDRDDHPRINLPFARGSDTYEEMQRDRTAIERIYSRLHDTIPHGTYRRRYLWQLGGALFVLERMARIARRGYRDELDDFWDELDERMSRDLWQRAAAA